MVVMSISGVEFLIMSLTVLVSVAMFVGVSMLSFDMFVVVVVIMFVICMAILMCMTFPSLLNVLFYCHNQVQSVILTKYIVEIVCILFVCNYCDCLFVIVMVMSGYKGMFMCVFPLVLFMMVSSSLMAACLRV